MTASWCFQRRNIPGHIAKTPKRLSPQNDGDWTGVEDVRQLSGFRIVAARGAVVQCYADKKNA